MNILPFPELSLEDLVKKRLNCKHAVIAGVMDNEDEDFITFISPELSDIQLVYIIKTLQDRRDMKVNDI